MTTRVREYTFSVSGSFRTGRPFMSEFLVYATTRDEATRQLELCLSSFEEVSESRIDNVSEADADEYGTEQYLDEGAFAVFDPRFTSKASDS